MADKIRLVVAAIWPFSEIIKWVQECVNDMVVGIAESLDGIYSNMDTIYGNSFFENARAAAKTLGISLVLLFAFKHILNVYVLEVDGDADTDPLSVIVKCSKAFLVIAASDLIMQMAFDFSRKLCMDLVGTASWTYSSQDMCTMLLSTISLSWANILLLLIYVIFFAIMSIKALLRGVELAIMSVLMPLMACDIMTVRQERWNSFFGSFFTVSVGYIIQILLFKVSIEFSLSQHLMISIACIYFAMSAPKWLEKFTYTSGVSHTVRGGAQMALMSLRFRK